MIDNIKNLLVCVDGSDSSMKAITKSIEIARMYKINIIALYISHIPSNIRRVPRYYLDELHTFNMEKIKAWLKDIIIQANKENINIEIRIRETTSSIVDEIIKNVEEIKTDLIVLGSTGKSKLEKTLIGSIAQGIIANTSSSVLLVR